MGRWTWLVAIACLLALVVAACAEVPVTPSAQRLDLQVRNSGLPGGYVWLSPADQPGPGRWHQFGMAEFFCVTCPVPVVGSGTGYDLAILDEFCRTRATYRTVGGQLLVEIDLGPTVRLVQAPPLRDWMPEDSMPADPASIPCSRPAGHR